MELIIVWLLFGIVTAIVAGTKGRTGCGWGLIGFLLGPFGLLLVLVLPANRQEIEKWEVEGGDKKKCPHCAELVKKEAIKCKHCGSDLSPPPDPPEPPRPENWGEPLEGLDGSGDFKTLPGSKSLL